MVDIDEHEYFMREALLEGEKALTRAEVPVGCVFVYKGEIIARASNRVNELYNATMHAEIVAIESIAATYGDTAKEVLTECTLYVTCEPCIMCAGALAHVLIKHVYFGCHNDRFGGCSSVLNLHERSALPNSNVHRGFPCVSGILKDEAITLLKKFYTSENPRVEDSKKKRKKRGPGSEENEPIGQLATVERHD
ncbi:tRNA-specific adenosine deaminase 2 [Phytophthora ramorum]|nr:tRNA-specific adenosine deaminase 2 [Phytophthora ramorum]